MDKIIAILFSLSCSVSWGQINLTVTDDRHDLQSIELEAKAHHPTKGEKRFSKQAAIKDTQLLSVDCNLFFQDFSEDYHYAPLIVRITSNNDFYICQFPLNHPISASAVDEIAINLADCVSHRQALTVVNLANAILLLAQIAN